MIENWHRVCARELDQQDHQGPVWPTQLAIILCISLAIWISLQDWERDGIDSELGR